MKFRGSGLDGGWIIDLDRIEDDRGWFARAWCADEFAEHGLPTAFPQTNMSLGHRRGTIRGLHLQLPPHREAKALRCIAGRIVDVAVDLRPDSPTYLQTSAVELSAESGTMVYVPDGCAHGYQALEDGSTVLYMTSSSYTPGAERGLRWDDPAVAFSWPVTDDVVVSPKDQAWPTFDPDTWAQTYLDATTEGSPR